MTNIFPVGQYLKLFITFFFYYNFEWQVCTSYSTIDVCHICRPIQPGKVVAFNATVLCPETEKLDFKDRS